MPRISSSVLNGSCFLYETANLNLFLAGVEKRAFKMARFAIGDDDAALDIVQDTMLVFVRRYRDRPDSEWPPLFFTVLQSRIGDAHRRQSVRLRVLSWLGFSEQDEQSADPIQEFADPRGDTPLRQLERAVLGERLEQAVARLPLRQQQAFLLRSWEGLDVAATAAAMGCSEGSVKTHYFRAVQALRSMLEEFRP